MPSQQGYHLKQHLPVLMKLNYQHQLSNSLALSFTLRLIEFQNQALLHEQQQLLLLNVYLFLFWVQIQHFVRLQYSQLLLLTSQGLQALIKKQQLLYLQALFLLYFSLLLLLQMQNAQREHLLSFCQLLSYQHLLQSYSLIQTDLLNEELGHQQPVLLLLRLHLLKHGLFQHHLHLLMTHRYQPFLEIFFHLHVVYDQQVIFERLINWHFLKQRFILVKLKYQPMLRQQTLTVKQDQQLLIKVEPAFIEPSSIHLGSNYCFDVLTPESQVKLVLLRELPSQEGFVTHPRVDLSCQVTFHLHLPEPFATAC